MTPQGQAIAGSQVKKPKYYRTIAGSTITNFIKDNLREGNTRIIRETF